MITTEELKQLRHLTAEVNELTESINSLNVPPSLSMNRTQKKEYAAAVSELRKTLQDRRQDAAAQLKRLRAFMDSAQDDPVIGDAFRRRYEKGQTWLHIFQVYCDRGYYYAEDTIKKKCQRYLTRYNENEAENNTEKQAAL